MHFRVEVGLTEMHMIGFSFNPWFGKLAITVDEEPVVTDLLTLSFTRSKRYEFPVGERERHVVRIEKIRERLVPAVRRQTCRVSVDGGKIGEYVGGLTTGEMVPTYATNC
jgi:hypothetical protein